jgi:hypothetical protein
MSICVFFIIFFNIFCNTLLIISNYVLHNWDVPPPPLSPFCTMESLLSLWYFNKRKYRKISSRYLSGKSLRLKDLFFLWSQVRVLWLLIWWLLETYMVVNFRTRGISRDTFKLARTPILIYIYIYIYIYI